MNKDIKPHPACSVFPMMSEQEFAGLVADIKENGQREPILLNKDGLLVDGRNRYKACQQLNISPASRTIQENGSVVSLVVSMNLHRRHLSYDQRVGVGLKLRPMLKSEAEKRRAAQGARGKEGGRGNKKAETHTANSQEGFTESAELAAAQVKVGTRVLYEAIAAEKENPDLSDELIQGSTTVKAERKKERKKKQQRKQHTARQAASKSKEKPWVVTAAQGVVECAALITDPPYGILEEEWEPGDLEKFTKDWAARWNTCNADTALIFWSQRYMWDGRQWFDETLTDYKFQQLLVWHYPNNKSPQSRMGFKQTWEPVFFYRRTNSKRKVQVSGDEWGKDLTDFDCHVAAVPQSTFKDAEMKQHPAQKPVSVFRWLVNAVTEPGELVCDPFAGSGTSGIAAVKLGRRYHGIEISKEFRELAEGRIATYGVR